mgnify:CR=1 FL=1
MLLVADQSLGAQLVELGIHRSVVDLCGLDLDGEAFEGGKSDLGPDVDLDLNEGRPKDEQIRQPQPGEESSDSGTAAKPKKTAKKKKKKRKKKKVSKRDFSDLKDKAGDDELIIY